MSYERYSISWQVLIQTFQRIKTWRVDRCKIVSQLKHNYHRSRATAKFHQGESNLGDRCETNDIPDRCVFVASAQPISRITCELYRAKKLRWTRSMKSVKHRSLSWILPHDFCMYLLPRFFAAKKNHEDSSLHTELHLPRVLLWRRLFTVGATFCSPSSWPNRRNYFAYSGQSRKCIEPTKRQPLEARAVRLRFYRSLKLFRGILLSNLLLVFIKIERMKITVLNGKTGPIRIYVAHVCWFSLKISLRSLKFKFVTYVYTI